MQTSSSILALIIGCLLVGGAAGYMYATAQPNLFAPTWPSEEAATTELQNWITKTGTSGGFTITETDGGAWVIIRDEAAAE